MSKAFSPAKSPSLDDEKNTRIQRLQRTVIPPFGLVIFKVRLRWAIFTVSHRPRMITSPVDFKLHHYLRGFRLLIPTTSVKITVCLIPARRTRKGSKVLC